MSKVQNLHLFLMVFWFRNLQLRWHGGICKEAGQECKEEEGAFHQEIFQTKKQLATEASTDFCPSSFVLVHVCMFIQKNWARCAFSASYMMTFPCTVYIHIYVYTRGCACSTCQQCHNYHLSRLVMVLHTISSVLCVFSNSQKLFVGAFVISIYQNPCTHWQGLKSPLIK